MKNGSKHKLKADVAEAIDFAVQHALDERLEEAEDEIVQKVMRKLDRQTQGADDYQHGGLFNGLGGP
jgi:hypothetical protein